MSPETKAFILLVVLLFFVYFMWSVNVPLIMPFKPFLLFSGIVSLLVFLGYFIMPFLFGKIKGMKSIRTTEESEKFVLNMWKENNEETLVKFDSKAIRVFALGDNNKVPYFVHRFKTQENQDVIAIVDGKEKTIFWEKNPTQEELRNPLLMLGLDIQFHISSDIDPRFVSGPAYPYYRTPHQVYNISPGKAEPYEEKRKGFHPSRRKE